MPSNGGPDSGHEERVHLVRGARIVLRKDAEQSTNFDANLRRAATKVEIDQLAD